MNDELQPLRTTQGGGPSALLVPTYPPNRFSTAALLRLQFQRCVTAMRRRWWVFSLTFLLLGGPAIFYAVTGKPTFRSEAVLWRAGTLTLVESGQGDRLSLPEDATYVGTQAELIKSDAIQARAFQKVRAAFPEFLADMTNANPAGLPFKLTVETSPKNSVLELKAEGPSPEATRAFLDDVIGEYFAVKNAYLKRNSSGALSSITDQIHQVEKQIQTEQNDLTLFQMSNNVPYLTEHGVSAGTSLANLTQVLSDLRTEYNLLDLINPEQFKDLGKGSEYSFSESALPGEKAARAVAINGNLAADTAYYQALQQIEQLKAERDVFSKDLRPTHSKMIKLNQQIAGLDQLLRKLKSDGGQQALVEMTNRKKALELQIKNLENQYCNLETNATEASRKLTEYDRINQNLLRSQALYDRLLSLLQTVDLNNNMDKESLTALGPASAARESLSRYKIPAAGLFVAIVAAFGLTFLLEISDDRFTSASEAPLVLPADVLGQIPESRLPARNGTPALLLSDEQPAFAEAFRNLRTSLLFMDSNSATLQRIILVTSAAPKEGKTTVAVNLARSLAISGSRVLLVDADFRRCSVHRHFGLRLTPGLLDVLNHAVSFTEAIVTESEPNLFVLPAGEAEGKSPDFLLRQRMGPLLRDLAATYDYIVFDTAPVLATDEAVSLGPMMDGVFLVVRNSYTSSSAVQEAARRLQLCNVNILGIVYNRADPSIDYYSRYTREYYSGRPTTRAAGPLAR